MPRIAGVNIPENKRILISLTYIYGLGSVVTKNILDEIKIDGNRKASDLTQDEIKKLKDLIEKKYRVEGDLRRDIMMNIKRLREVGSYRGSRHIKKLPARGQRTKTNSRTIRGNVRRTVGSGKKGAPAPK
ncbi:MAG: 30S ribosomal protein S13 [Candidatus Nealsonbacteria bacterium]|nr:30S ribosomal protein S13 [Candidatus Nealsonbacteria bacterium]